MPRKLLRDGRVVEDDWQYLAETQAEDRNATGSESNSLANEIHHVADAPNPGGLILPFDQWLSERDRWLEHTGRLGVVLLPAHKVERLGPDISRFELIGAEFPGPSDGRGYTQGRLLRERWKFGGELRATGYVRHDQLFFLARCGFNSFELPESDLAQATRAFTTFSAEYQPSNDAGLPLKLQHR
jgi:uncharacterized protein (DUF934 family)